MSHTPLSDPSSAGVLYAHIHGAKDLIGGQLYGVCNPVCVVKDGEKTLLVTRRHMGCVDPVWEQGVEIFIPNYKTVSTTSLHTLHEVMLPPVSVCMCVGVCAWECMCVGVCAWECMGVGAYECMCVCVGV